MHLLFQRERSSDWSTQHLPSICNNSYDVKRHSRFCFLLHSNVLLRQRIECLLMNLLLHDRGVVFVLDLFKDDGAILEYEARSFNSVIKSLSPSYVLLFICLFIYADDT